STSGTPAFSTPSRAVSIATAAPDNRVTNSFWASSGDDCGPIAPLASSVRSLISPAHGFNQVQTTSAHSCAIGPLLQPGRTHTIADATNAFRMLMASLFHPDGCSARQEARFTVWGTKKAGRSHEETPRFYAVEIRP